MVKQESDAMMDLQKDLDQEGQSGDEEGEMDIDEAGEVSEEQERLAHAEEHTLVLQTAQKQEQERMLQQVLEEQVSQQEQGQLERILQPVALQNLSEEIVASLQREKQEQERLAQEQEQEQKQEHLAQQERFAEQQERTPQEQEQLAQQMLEEQLSVLDATLLGSCPEDLEGSEANVSAQAAPPPLPNVPGKFCFYCYDVKKKIESTTFADAAGTSGAPGASRPPSPTQHTPPSTPPTFIRDQMVHSPSGMLVSNIEVFPPSSQSTLPLPPLNRRYRLLNVPHSRVTSPYQGRMTRSRLESGSGARPLSTRPPSPLSRAASRKPGSQR